ncbi:Asp-tRNA(Asn)/Glu-tRNA(Gln) amidotransferase subunit GatC [Candidatus Epulonipiscium viviparus]|nr:Asp-tRNA(Asn)/Glu-tRNA(Gln) amidotransferase subunit GatC [Candidatus Epulopiscium viviparus]
MKPSTAEVTNVLRTDVVTNINRRDEMLSNAKTKENGMILIKKVIE